MNSRFLAKLVVGFIVCIFLLLFSNSLFPAPSQDGTAPSAIHVVSYTEFLAASHSGKIKRAILADRVIDAYDAADNEYVVLLPPDARISEQLVKDGVDLSVSLPKPETILGHILTSMAPMLIILAVWLLVMRRMNGRGNPFSLGRSPAVLHDPETSKRITFADVAGVDEAKAELTEVVDFLRDPAKYQRLGGRIPKGVLLVGPPGTGKTLLARAVAGEANVPFFSISGSDFVEMVVGVGASRVRDMFAKGKKNAPCIIFIDEIDAMGRKRGSGWGGGNDEREQTLNQMLVEMDGFEGTEGVILIAATNRPDVLDNALLRPGRFDRQVFIGSADVKGRAQILRVHANKLVLAPDVDMQILARATPGFSGADLANLVNEAALLAGRLNLDSVGMAEFEAAKDKVMMGTERRSLVMSDAEKRMTAYHEAGHAICALSDPECDPVHKATIVPRGRALGMVMSLPEGDRYSKSLAKLNAELMMTMGGRAAEELAFGATQVSNGAQGDIRMATDKARQMVCEWGMGEGMGMMAYDRADGSMFSQGTGSPGMSEATAREVDAEIRRMLDVAYKRAKAILSDRMADLHRVASRLLEQETLDGDQLREMLPTQDPATV